MNQILYVPGETELFLHRKRIKNNVSNYSLNSFHLISFVLIIVCVFKIVGWTKDNSNNSDLQSTLVNSLSFSDSISDTSSGDSEKTLDFTEMLNMNPNTVGWIVVPGTEVNYSVVQGKNNDYYLNHSFDNTVNSAGWIFADYRNIMDGSDKNIIIYGHNRRDGTMFSSLKNILNKDWYLNEENRTITLYTPNGTLKYRVFSIYQIEAINYDTRTSFTSDRDFLLYANNIKNNSIYDYDEEITADDKIITLSTCANNNAYRVVLHAKLINDNANEQV